MDVKEELTNADTRAKYKHIGNWNRRIQIPGVWSGHVKDIPPHAVEALIKQGRKDFVEIEAGSKSSESKEHGKPKEVASKEADKK